MEAVRGLLGWYLAPWRRIGRGEFAAALTLATLPGLFVMVFGWGGSAGHYLAPLLDVMAGGDPAGALGGLMAAGGDTQPAFSIDWTGVMNSLLLLALVPLCRMRLRDMGWFGWQEMALAVVFNVSVAGGLVECLTGYNPLPWGLVWGIANFAGYAWMSLAKGTPRKAVHERADYDKPVGPDQRIDDEHRDFPRR